APADRSERGVRGRAPLTLAALGAAGLLVAALAACGGAPAPLPTPPPGAVIITAQGTAFVSPPYTAPANAAFTLFFENRDNEPHNVRVWDAANASVYTTEIIQGPAAKAEQVPALPAGTYRLTCDIHPDMTAQLNVQ
ncbi:MAG TPA: cupredoxin domain-containing protein, partial [Candidatus Limnocylindrales bacterium]